MKVSGSHITFLRKYMNDILIVGNDCRFAMKDLGETAYEINVKIYEIDLKFLDLNRSMYIDKILKTVFNR